MAVRADYDAIKQNFADYISTWNTRDKKEIDRLFHSATAFKTSTSITMANGNQDSIYGVYDFIDDFPVVDKLYTPIYNFACRVKGERGYAYAEVVCTALKKAEKAPKYFEFTIFAATEWEKENDEWKIISLRQEAVPHQGSLKKEFEKIWHFEEESETAGRIQMIRGEGDAPWYNVPADEMDDILTEEEKIKDCIIKNAYGVEQQAYLFTMDTLSVDYQCHRQWHSDGERAKDRVQQMKASRNLIRYYCCPVKFRRIEIKGSRAFAEVDRVRGHQQDLGFQLSTDGDVDIRKRICDSLKDVIRYEYTNENMDIEHTVARGTYELVKEDGVWKIGYDRLFFGLYEVGAYKDGYGDEC